MFLFTLYSSPDAGAHADAPKGSGDSSELQAIAELSKVAFADLRRRNQSADESFDEVSQNR